jgi:hypothetical protein
MYLEIKSLTIAFKCQDVQTILTQIINPLSAKLPALALLITETSSSTYPESVPPHALLDSSKEI